MKEAKFYRIEGYRNFFYGLMAPSTGYIEHFELRKYRRGVLLRFPHPSRPDRMPVFKDDRKLYSAFGEANKWQKLLEVAYLPDLNEKIQSGDARELILLSEALHEKKIAEIADKITRRKKRIILIADLHRPVRPLLPEDCAYSSESTDFRRFIWAPMIISWKEARLLSAMMGFPIMKTWRRWIYSCSTII